MARLHAKPGKIGGETVTASTIEEAISSKSWATRKHGYEAVATIFRNLEPRSPNWAKLSFLIEAIAEERNIPALEKGLEAALLFVQMCGTMNDETVTTLLNILKRCLADQKLRIRELATQICMKLVEKNKNDLVITMLLEGLEGRNARQAFACVRTLTCALTLFGPKMVNVSLITPKIVSLCVNKSFFQQEVKDLLREIYAFVGSAINEDLNALDPSQLKTMEIEFGKIDKAKAEKCTPSATKHQTIGRPESTKSVKNKPTSSNAQQRPISSNRQMQKKVTERIMSPRSDKQTTSSRVASAKKKEEGGACGDRFSPRNRNARGGAAQPQIGFDDIFSLIESKQWGDRKDALEGTLKVITSDKTMNPSAYNKIIKCLRNLILNDTNVLLISKAVQCVTAMAKKEDKAFRQHAPLMMTLLLEKFKEKKSVLVEAIREATDAIYWTSSFASIHRYVSLSLEHQNPAVKSETELFLCRCFANPNPEILKQIYWQPLVGNLVKNLAFQDQNVRQNATKALGVMMKAIGEQHLSPHLQGVQRHHMNMISTFGGEAVIEYRHPNSAILSYHSDGSTDIDDSCNDDIRSICSNAVKAVSERSDGTKLPSTVYTVKGTSMPHSSDEYEFSANSKCADERFYDAQEPTASDRGQLDTGPREGYASLTKHKKESRESTRSKSSKAYEEGRQSRSKISNDQISSKKKKRAKQLSPAAQEKLNALRTTIEQLKMWSDLQSSTARSPITSAKRNIEQEVAKKLENLESSVDTCFEEIRALSPLLYEEMNGSASSTADNPTILREFNKKLGRMERMLKSMAFDENLNKISSTNVAMATAIIRQGNGNWFLEGGY